MEWRFCGIQHPDISHSSVSFGSIPTQPGIILHASLRTLIPQFRLLPGKTRAFPSRFPEPPPTFHWISSPDQSSSGLLWLKKKKQLWKSQFPITTTLDMDTCSDCQGSDMLSFNSDGTNISEQAESPSLLSESCTARAAQSDEEVGLLASSRPKKRAGRRVFRETRHPVYRGVRRRNKNKWVCELREPNKKTRIWLGTYPTAEMAARAHDVAALALRGKSACLNFADSAWQLHLPSSTDAADIRRAAMEAAEALQPDEGSSEEAACDRADDKEHGWDTVGMTSQGGLSAPTKTNVMILPEIRTTVTEDYETSSGADQELFNMAKWIDRPLLSPPPSCSGHRVINWDCYDAECHDVDLTLWSYSM